MGLILIFEIALLLCWERGSVCVWAAGVGPVETNLGNKKISGAPPIIPRCTEPSQ